MTGHMIVIRYDSSMILSIELEAYLRSVNMEIKLRATYVGTVQEVPTFIILRINV